MDPNLSDKLQIHKTSHILCKSITRDQLIRLVPGRSQRGGTLENIRIYLHVIHTFLGSPIINVEKETKSFVRKFEGQRRYRIY